MKKVLFYILLIISLYLAFSIIKILLYDIKRLTEYGYGFLTGQILLFLIIGIITYKIRPKK